MWTRNDARTIISYSCWSISEIILYQSWSLEMPERMLNKSGACILPNRQQHFPVSIHSCYLARDIDCVILMNRFVPALNRANYEGSENPHSKGS